MLDGTGVSDVVGAVGAGAVAAWAWLQKNTEGWTKKQWAIAVGLGVVVTLGVVLIVGN